MTALCAIAQRYGTDKAGLFTPVYDLLLRHHRAGVRKVLEIGIGTKEAMQHVPNYKPGASMRMWADYFPNALVYGADIVACDLPGAIQLDQGNAAQLDAVGKRLGPFDLVVDDGSHFPHHQILGVQTLLKYVKKGGLYIIEDVNNFDEIMRGVQMPCLCISYPDPYKHAARCMVFNA